MTDAASEFLPLEFSASFLVCLFCFSMLENVRGDESVLNNQKSPPNFIIIFADDLGYGDLGVFGATDIAIPHIDRMAREGIQFTNFYVGGAVCTPSRASLLTGCYPKRVGLQNGVLFPNDKLGLHPNEITIADLLKKKRYATACIGKWHLGRPSELMPTSQGFDDYFGVPYSNDMLPTHVLSKAMGGFPELPLMKKLSVIEAPVDQTTLAGRYTAEAIRLIQKNGHKPFFIYLAHSMSHYPCYSSGGFVDSSKRGSFGDAVQEIDDGVGRIIQTLKELAIDENNNIYAERPEVVARLRDAASAFDNDITKNSRPVGQVP
jgi:arylsulfatase A-like enzyme